MQVRRKLDTEAVFVADLKQFDVMTSALGCRSDEDRARLISVNVKTISRARQQPLVGGKFVANTLAALAEHRPELVAQNLHPSFDALFRVGLRSAA